MKCVASQKYFVTGAVFRPNALEDAEGGVAKLNKPQVLGLQPGLAVGSKTK
jgi:hypothetical protein